VTTPSYRCDDTIVYCRATGSARCFRSIADSWKLSKNFL